MQLRGGDKDGEIITFANDGEVVTIGRHNSNKVVMIGDGVSRFHATVKYDKVYGWLL